MCLIAESMRSSCILIGLLIHVVFLASASKWDRPCSPVIYNISSSRHVPCLHCRPVLALKADMKHGASVGPQTSSMSTSCLTHMMTAAG